MHKDLILEIIEDLKSQCQYNSYNFNLEIKKSVLEAFEKLTQEEKFQKYLSGTIGTYENYQSKLFQISISSLEDKIPFQYKKGNEIIKIKSLLDLNIFDGLSQFNFPLDGDEIINNTIENFNNKKFFIGKIIDIFDFNNKHSLLPKIDWYNFSKIKIKEKIKTEVIVSHLRLKPSYQSGLMATINKMRKQISQKIECQK